MYRYAIILLASQALAGEATLTWTAPTENDDGSPLTDLARYWVQVMCDGGYTDEIDVSNPGATSYVVEGLPDVGVCRFTVQAENSTGIRSLASNEAQVDFGLPELPGKAAIEVTWAEYSGPVPIYVLSETDFGDPLDIGDFNARPDALEIAFTVEPDSFLNRWPRVVSKASGTAEQDHVWMVSLADEVLRFRLKTDGVTSTILGTSIVPIGLTTQGRVTYDGQFMRLYVNGTLEASAPKTGLIDQTDARVVVGANPPGSFRFDGRIALSIF